MRAGAGDGRNTVGLAAMKRAHERRQTHVHGVELEHFHDVAQCLEHQPACLVKMQQCAAWALFLTCCGSLESRSQAHELADALRAIPAAARVAASC